ncbi:MAG: S41 family peptidase [Verrucomicrobiae bacterium]|nr:S41 family peptidase [Verrucomicrobiae bacterium]
MRISRVSFLIVVAAAAVIVRGDTQGRAVDFSEVYQLLRSNLVGVGKADLDSAALQGILDKFHGRVSLVTTNAAPKESGTQTPDVVRTNVFAERFAYIRLVSITPETHRTIVAFLDQLRLSNRLDGVTLDLRFVASTDYVAACKIADCFIADRQDLLRLGGETVTSTAKSNAFNCPVVVLVNSRTSGAAEALAAILRDRAASPVIGSRTSGQVGLFSEFPLSTGQKLLIATVPVQLASGENLQPNGVEPDITVKVGLEEEKLFLEDPYRRPTSDSSAASAAVGDAPRGTNRPPREADLVRMRREGSFILSEDQTQKTQVPIESTITDPAVVRAIDLLKGLAVMQQQRSIGRRVR